jgi:hypothetical protein
MKKRCFSLASMMTLCFLLLLIGGCGSSSNKESGSAGVSNVGDTPCIQCHSANREALTGETLIAQYQNSSPHKDSVHANAGNGCEACHGSASQHQGKGPIAYVNPYDNSGARCADCHKGNYAGNFNTKFASSNHASVTIEEGANCVRCHTHEGAVLSNIAGVTGDYNVITNKAYQTIPIPARGWSQFKCQTCHEHGGGLRTVMARYNNPWKPADPANGTLMAWDPNGNREHDAFDLCTSCHTMLTNSYPTGIIGANGRETSSPLYMGSGTPGHAATGKPPTVKAGYHDTSWYRQLTSTHFDNPATGLDANNVALSTGNVIEGYVLRMGKENPCFDCHAHEAKAGTRYGQTTTPTIYTDWAQSAHAGFLLKAKYAAAAGKSGAAQVDSVMVSGVGDGADTSTNYPAVDAAGAPITITRATTNGAAWSHYQWEKSQTATGTSDRGDCQRCHTATGAANFLSSPATYDYKNNDFSHLTGWVKASAGKATTPSPQQEVLYCWGCHTNAGTGALRKPGALSFTYTNKATVTYPDIAGSNICLSCHTGRETGDSIKNDTNATGVRSFLNSHYLAAGGQLFGTTGYEYAGLNYANPSYFAHDKIGSSAAPGTGSNGPCVGCHMTTSSSHKFTNVTKNSAGAITAINSTACVTCHSGNYALTPAKLTEEEEEYQDAIAAAKAAMAGKGLYFIAAHPYWYKDPAGGSANAFTNWAGVYGLAKWKDVMGAAFNINLLIHDPGGYAHNRYYVKRLLWDSMDLITNGTLGDINMTATIDGLASLTAAQKAGAKKYLGTARP